MLLELFPMTVGFLGSLHCLGMCGPLVVAYSLHIAGPGDPFTASSSAQTQSLAAFAPARGLSWPRGLMHHAAFHLGRLLSYGALGGLAAGLFQAADVSRFFFDIRDSVTMLGGVLLIFAGLVLLKVVPLPACLSALATGQGSFIGRKIPPLLRSSRPTSKLFLGLALGFMPCCLSWAMIVTAATTRSPLHGFLTMVAFGIGTMPALLFTGLFASFLSVKVRFLGEQAAALSVVAMGVILILKGVGIIE